MSKPHILIVPGFWEGPHVFDAVTSMLQSRDFKITMAPLVSTGKVNPADGSSEQLCGMHDDIAAIRKVVEPLVDQGSDVVMVMHSAGGFLGSNAIDGLSRKARSDKDLPGGVAKIVFLAAVVVPEGYEHTMRPLFDIRGDELWPNSPRETLFNDLTDDGEAEKYTELLSRQPATGWGGVTTYAGWMEVPSVYLVCDKDLILSKDVQTRFATLAGSEFVNCDAGHMVQLTQPDTVVDLIVKAASGCTVQLH